MIELFDVTLGEVTINFDSRRRPVKGTDRVHGKYPYYGASGVVDHVDGYLFDGEYLLVAEDGENLRSRSTPVAFIATDKFWVNNHAHVVRGNERANTRYLSYLLSATDVSGYITGSTQPKLTRTALDSIRLSVPAVHHQQAIVEVLGALDDKIAANAKLAGTIESLLELEAAAQWLGVEGAEETSILDIFDVNPSLPRPTGAEPIYVDMRKLPESGSGISEWERRPAKGGARFQLGDTLLARITPCLENRKTGFVDFLEPGEVAVGSTEFIVLRTKYGYANPISYFLATHPAFRQFAIRHMVGTSGRQRVAASDIASYTLPRPDEAWLRDFGKRATDQFLFLKSLRDENRTLAATRDALLPQLMSGKLRVKDAENLVTEVA